MLRHLRAKHPSSSALCTLGSQHTGPVPSGKQREVDEAVLNMIIKDLQPFSIVEDEGFRAFVESLDPSCIIPTSKALKNMVHEKYQEAKRKTVGELEEVKFVSLTADMWTSVNMDVCLGMTCHYITEKSELDTALLGVKKLSQTHRAEDIKEAKTAMLSDWGLSGKVNCLVTHNAANMIAYADLLQVRHVPCFAHTLNSLVKKAMAQTDGLQGIRHRTRQIVGLLKASTTAQERLSNMQDQMGMQKMKLVQEVEARWSSTFLMLQRIHQLREPVGAVLATLKTDITPLSSAEYDTVKYCLSVLAPFFHAATELSEEKRVSASKVIPIITMIQHNLTEKCALNHNQVASVLSSNLQRCLNVHYGGAESVNVLALATLLDPRFKTIAFGNPQHAQQAERSLIAECASLLPQSGPPHSLKGSSLQQLKMETSTDETPGPSATSSGKDSLWELLDSSVTEAQKVHSSTADAAAEVMRYLNSPYLPRTGDPLDFWRKHSAIYPHLFTLARKYLSMPASSVPCSHIFSKAGEIMCQKRNRLSPSTLEKILFLNKNL
ncbi:zinc finger BED domain-containing protein 4-like isoform X2 [Brienomyrus brachyistius]|nr:zinc finger BED domain-containing protein 4-like isoform X2 [Brienomyrus brachyistius]